ncbi:CAP domain-containing protein [Streptomyces hesseae]|uniref:RICIN domain-containing protein n=1 Tax=Streptomyces hesseae TaxID=3075519 RepID=A0ABU2SGG5_9ACTN|nr:ricin-type beta-trefoil lectin domain protein [Streptomyces sp. DSM 40473]MDT0448058.1 RICIN domain-containing protein [Streptomyces sp. DSM 40473]
MNALTKQPPKKSYIWGTLVLAALGVATLPAPAQAAAQAGPLVGLAGKCLDVRGGVQDSGTPVQLYGCNGTESQRWTYVEQPGETGATMTAFGKCLDVASSGTADGTPVRLWDCNGSNAQKWVRHQGDVLVNPQSNKCLDVRGGNTDDGTPVQIYSCNNSASQVWKFSDGGAPKPNPDPGSLQRQVFDLVNDYRAQHGKARLEYDPVVEHAAQDEADEQSRRQQQGHYIGTIDSLRKYGYSRSFSEVAENAAGARGFWKDARSVVDAWIKEPLHERNILDDRHRYTGVGVTIDTSGTYWWAQDFVG